MIAPAEVGKALAHEFFSRRPSHGLPWRWDAGVAMLGLARLMRVDEDTRREHLVTLHDYQRAHLRTRSIALPDHCLSAQPSVMLLDWEPNTEARFAIDRVAAYLLDAPENALGVLDHLGRRVWYRHLLRPGAWVDSMMMYVLTAARLGRFLRLPALEVLARRHALRFCEHLQSEVGLFRHAKLLPDRRTPVHWLRGNGWAAYSLVQLHAQRPTDGIRRALQRQAACLARLQRSDGLWSTVIDDARSPPEASGSALVACALAQGARQGVLGDWAARAAVAAWQGLCALLSPTRDGMTLGGISGPSIPASACVYKWTPRLTGLSYGIGAMMMLAAELSGGSGLLEKESGEACAH